MEGGLCRLDRRRLERARRFHRLGRTGPAAPDQCRVPGDVACRRDGVRARPLADHGGSRCACRARRRGAQADLSAQARLRRVDGDDAAHRAAGGLGPLRAAHQGRATPGWHLPHHRPKNLHHLRRARSHRQHRAFRAGATARRAARHPGDLAVSRSEISGQSRRHARGEERRALPFGRAQARNPRLADLHHGVRG